MTTSRLALVALAAFLTSALTTPVDAEPQSLWPSGRREAEAEVREAGDQDVSEADVREREQAILFARLPSGASSAPASAPVVAQRTERASRGSPDSRAGGPGRAFEGRLIWPADGPVTSEFGSRWGRRHTGIDIGAARGAPVRAATRGRVSFTGAMGGYGNTVTIDHGGGFSTLYAHQSRIGSGRGQGVGQGQVIGYVGCTGNCTGPHLHFETRINGTPQNPRRYL